MSIELKIGQLWCDDHKNPRKILGFEDRTGRFCARTVEDGYVATASGNVIGWVLVSTFNKKQWTLIRDVAPDGPTGCPTGSTGHAGEPGPPGLGDCAPLPGPVDHTAEHVPTPYFNRNGYIFCELCGCADWNMRNAPCHRNENWRARWENSATIQTIEWDKAHREVKTLPEPTVYQSPVGFGIGAAVCGGLRGRR